MKEYYKFTSGYVSQHFVKKGTRYVCTSQNFIAWDQEANREDEAGKSVSIDPSKEVYFPFEMKQPKPE